MQTNDPRGENHAIRHNGSLETERAFLSYSKEGRRDTALTVAAFDYPPTLANQHALVWAEIARLEDRDLDAMGLQE
jgi:hypothetical protein